MVFVCYHISVSAILPTLAGNLIRVDFAHFLSSFVRQCAKYVTSQRYTVYLSRVNIWRKITAPHVLAPFFPATTSFAIAHFLYFASQLSLIKQTTISKSHFNTFSKFMISVRYRCDISATLYCEHWYQQPG